MLLSTLLHISSPLVVAADFACVTLQQSAALSSLIASDALYTACHVRVIVDDHSKMGVEMQAAAFVEVQPHSHSSESLLILQFVLRRGRSA